MFTTLSWTNTNQIPVITAIYRSLTPLTQATLGTPLVTLTNGELTWTDTTADPGQTYYYVIKTINSAIAGDFVLSSNFKTKNVIESGPGPQTMKFGNLDLGYYGKLTQNEFITRDALRLSFGFSVKVKQPALATLGWHKFVRKGKVLFVPDCPIMTGAAWLDLYNLGLVFGYSGTGKGDPANLPAVPVQQMQTVTIADSQFIVRLPTGYDDTHANSPSGLPLRTEEYVSAYSNEWDDIFFSMNINTPDGQKIPNTDTFASSELLYSNVSAGGGKWYPCGAVCQETSGVGMGISRGGGPNNTYKNRSQISAISRIETNPPYGGADGSGYATYTGVARPISSIWWPVLELVEA